MASSAVPQDGVDEFYRIAFRKKIYGSIADLQVDLDRWVQSYNEERPHQGRWCFGKTPIQTFLDATPLAKEKMIGKPPWRCPASLRSPTSTAAMRASRPNSSRL